jgi:hypothetical protein
MATRAAIDFSWPQALGLLRRPGPPPPGLLPVAFALLTACSGALAILIWAGAARHGLTHYYFRERQPGTYLSFLVLIASGVLCAVIGRGLGDDSFARFWLLTGLGFVYLGLDDLLGIHEEIDYRFHWLLGWNARDSLTRHMDDVIVASYGFIALPFAYRYRARLAELPWMVLILALSSVPFGGMVLLDVTNWSTTAEESLKLVAGVLIFIGFYAGRLELRRTAG